MNEDSKDYRFIVIFRPKKSWADDIYFGNMLIEVLGQVASMTGAFDFDVKKIGDEEQTP